jgi:oligo-1,6-glucosidase
MVFQFEHVGIDHGATKWDLLPLDLVALKQSLHRWQVALAARGWNSLYWDNHDQPRVVSRFGDDAPAVWAASAKALGTILHGMRGTPYVYQGEELGMTSFPWASADQFQDVESVNHWRDVLAGGEDRQEAFRALAAVSRDNARTPMQWDDSGTAGFTTGSPWLPVNPNRSWLNAAAQRNDPRSVFAHHAALIRLRHEQPILAEGDFAGLLENDPEIWAYTRSTAAQRLLVLANCGGSDRELELGDGWTGARLLLGSLPGTPAALTGGAVTLAPWDARMYLLG